MSFSDHSAAGGGYPTSHRDEGPPERERGRDRDGTVSCF